MSETAKIKELKQYIEQLEAEKASLQLKLDIARDHAECHRCTDRSCPNNIGV